MNIEIDDSNKIVSNFATASNNLFNLLAETGGWARREAKVINEFQKQLPVLFSLVEGIEDNEPNIPFQEKRDQVLSIWKQWKLHLAHEGFYYNPYSERAAISYISGLVLRNPDNFITVLEYAMSVGYTKINPEIITYAIPEEMPKVKTLFSNSDYADFQKFKKQFDSNYNNVDLKFYYDKLLFWSNSQDRQSADWISMCKSFIQKDAREDKLQVMDSRKMNTTKKLILGTIMQASNLLNKYFTYLKNFPEEFWKNLKPKSFIEGKLIIEIENYDNIQIKENEIISYCQKLTDYINQNEKSKIHITFSPK